MSLENNPNIVNHFAEVKGFRIAKQENSRIIYEKFYDNLKNYLPRKNETTNEVERCIIIIELHELKNNLREIAISVNKHFPSGTDFGQNRIIDCNNKPDFVPLDFDCFNEYFLNEQSGELYKKKHKIKLNVLLNKLYLFHIRPTKSIMGIFLRTKLKLRHQIHNIVRTTIKVLEFVMRFTCGKYVMKENILQEAYLETMKREQIKIVEGNSIKIPIGWKCSKNVAFVSCLLIILFAYFLWNSIKSNAVIAMFLFPTWIIILYLLEIILPIILLFFINGLIKIKEYKRI